MKRWFVIYCKSKSEYRAQQHLSNLGIDSLLPKMIKEKILRGKKTQIEQVLFPNYIFICIDESTANFNKIRSTRGVSHFVRFGHQYAQLSEAMVQQLKALCDNDGHQQIDSSDLLQMNDEVKITTGPFKGLTAIFDCEDGLERSMLMLNILNQDNKISFKNTEISKT